MLINTGTISDRLSFWRVKAILVLVRRLRTLGPSTSDESSCKGLNSFYCSPNVDATTEVKNGPDKRLVEVSLLYISQLEIVIKVAK